MPLTPGTKLGPYEIESVIGVGGMGEVYRANDPRLLRTVAIKVLPTHLNANPEVRARFEREARAISALQHPNICVLFDVGSQGDIDYLVMEYLEGETLFTRLARKPLSTEESLKIATEIADALDKAHRSGIVHRDLKPGNVMLTKSGAKLMDFGLAKPVGLATGPRSGAQDITSMATMAVATIGSMASPVTVAGTLVGTVQYMSPEQIQGKEADARSDIFAFGAMLYEMLTNKRAFEGKSQLSLASAILEKDPDPIAAVQPMTPPALEQLVRTCLAKEPDDRFQSAHDLKLQLQWIAAAGSQVGAPALVTARGKKKVTTLTAALLAGWLLAAAAGVAALVYANRLTSAQQPVHTSIQPPAGFAFPPVQSGAPVLSPDGQQIAFVAIKRGAPRGSPTSILLFHLSSGEATEIGGAQGGNFPFWSPDGKYLGFFADGKLKKILIAGGPAQILCDAPDGRGGSWNEQGTIVFAPRIAGPLQSVSDGGGTPVGVTATPKDDAQFTDRNPYFLPNGEHFLYVQRGKDAVGSVYAASLAGGEPKQILSSGSNVAYTDGYLFFVKEGTLTVQEFDLSTLSFKGKPTPIAASVEFYKARNLAYFSVSQNALLFHTESLPSRELVWLDASGKEIEHWAEPAPYLGAYYSSSAQVAVLYRANPTASGTGLWVADLRRKTVNRFTPDVEPNQTAVISPDGNDIYVATTTGYISTLTRRSLGASGEEETVLDHVPSSLSVQDISRDGRMLLLAMQDPKTAWDIYYLDLKGERKLVPLLHSRYNENAPALSPDGKWLAYVSDETGRQEAYVTPFPATGSKWQISNAGANQIGTWSSDGKTFRYEQGDKIYSVEMRLKGTKPEFSAPKELLTLPPNVNVFSILPDGKRILASRQTTDAVAEPVHFILNWQPLVH